MKYLSPGIYRLEPDDHVIGDECYVCGRRLALGETVVVADTGDGEVITHDHRPAFFSSETPEPKVLTREFFDDQMHKAAVREGLE